MMGDIINTLINYQIGLFASGPAAAVIFVTTFDCLLVYALSFLARRKVSQAEMSLVLFAIFLVIMVVLEFMQKGAGA